MNLARVLITGANGQIGRGIQRRLPNALATDLTSSNTIESLDVTNRDAFFSLCNDYKPTTIIHLASLLSVNGEQNPDLALHVNLNGTINAFDVAKAHGASVFAPSSIAVFGDKTPKLDVPDDTILNPNSVYGVTKIFLERLADYYHMKYGLDVRSVRYPGILCPNATGGGTTDYAVEAAKACKAAHKTDKTYTSFLGPDTRLPMMSIADCMDATFGIINAEPSRLTLRTYNITAVSFTPSELEAEIQKIVPEFKMEYQPDHRQSIADSWIDTIDDSAACRDWDWSPKDDLSTLVKNLLDSIPEQKL